MNTQDEKVVIVIPARYASSRLPGKPLADICGKPMIQHVYERALEVPHVQDVLVAVDDERVAKAVESFGGKYLMTSREHESGTDRLCEVMEQFEADIYVNIQGDEPLIRPADVTLLIKGMLSDKAAEVGTLYHLLSLEEASNPNAVKVVLSDKGNALYFSRSLIPYPRDNSHAVYRKHIGIYAYRRPVLQRYALLSQPMLELTEKLEQLRLLSSGIAIRCFEVQPTGPGVDTPECLERVRRIMSGDLDVS